MALIRPPILANKGREGGIRAEASLPFGNGQRMAAARSGVEDEREVARYERLSLIRRNKGLTKRERIIRQREAEREMRAGAAHRSRIPGESIAEWSRRLARERARDRRPDSIRT